jgi:hypothetical protein
LLSECGRRIGVNEGLGPSGKRVAGVPWQILPSIRLRMAKKRLNLGVWTRKGYKNVSRDLNQDSLILEGPLQL